MGLKQQFAYLVVGAIFVGFLLLTLAVWLGPFSGVQILLSSAFGVGIATPQVPEIERRLQVPPGFKLQLYASDLPNSRMLRFAGNGNLLVSQPREGKVTLLEPDRDGDGQADAKRVLLEGLQRPHGLDVWGDWLYIAEAEAVGRVRFDPVRGQVMGDYQRIIDDLPAEGNHWSKTARFGADGLLYVSIGSSCNVCVEQDARRATIMRYQPDGSGGEVFAAGLRNSVGFDWAPWNGELYATDNGRDLLGDDFPPCELNQVVGGGFYGWPYINGFGVADPDYGDMNEVSAATAISPVHGFRAHNAPLGIVFLRHKLLPPVYHQSALVALHGSWNRSRPDGYQVVSLHWQDNGRIVEKPFVSGFEDDGRVIGRPVDVAEGPDGCLYVSDDFAGAVYRVCYTAGLRAQ